MIAIDKSIRKQLSGNSLNCYLKVRIQLVYNNVDAYLLNT